MTLFIGIDDSGRGPIIGPLVLAGVLLTEKQKEFLKQIGVKDSKQLSKQRREKLSKEIKENSLAYKIVLVSPEEIDSRISMGVNLNKIEAIKTAEIINELVKLPKKYENGEIICFIDCPSNNISAWEKYLSKYIKTKKIELKCEHHADINHVECAAASILAKVVRDKAIERIKKKYKIECGSGYPSDPLCVEFLKTEKAKELAKQGLIRKSWQTWKKKEQKKLDEF